MRRKRSLNKKNLIKLHKLAEANMDLILSYIPDQEVIEKMKTHPGLSEIMETPLGFLSVILSLAGYSGQKIVFDKSNLAYLKDLECSGCGWKTRVAVCGICGTVRK